MLDAGVPVGAGPPFPGVGVTPPPGVPVSGPFAPPPPQATMPAKTPKASKYFIKETNRLAGRLIKAALLIFTLRKCFKRIIAAHGRQH